MSAGAVNVLSLSQQAAKSSKSSSNRKRQMSDETMEEQPVDSAKKTKKSRKSELEIKPTTAQAVTQALSANTPSPPIDVDDDDEDIFVPHIVKRAPEQMIWLATPPKEGWPATAYDNIDDIFPSGLNPETFVRKNPSHKYRAFASMLGEHISQMKVEIIRVVVELIIGEESVIVDNITADEETTSPWVMLSFKSKEARRRVVAQQAVMSRQAKQTILFRGITGEASNTRYAYIKLVLSKNYNELQEGIRDIYRAEKVEIWSAGGNKVNGLCDALARITLSNQNKLSYIVRANDEIQVEGGWRYRVWTPIKCSACHSNDHRAYSCKWKKLLGKITFDIEVDEDSSIALRT